MKIGTIIFTYNRSEHTRQVLDALSQNDILPEKLYLFQDGIKESTNIDEWNKVGELIRNINWCETEVHISDKNKGLAKSIVSGVSYVLQEYDAVIVLEDDCVPHKQFMWFMVSALHAYQKNEKVYSVSGCAWNIDLLYQPEDAYFNGRCCSLGWGTWKERWSQYEEDYNILSRIRENPEADERLRIWGNDLENMLLGKAVGANDSWAVFWALKIIEMGGCCLSAYKQLIHNIGFDGSGVHSVSAKRQDSFVMWDGEYQNMLRFPKEIESTDECKEEFQFMYGGKHGTEKWKLYQDLLLQWIQMKQEGKTMRIPDDFKTGIAIWGKGKVFDCLIREIKDQTSIKCIVESRPYVEEYNGIPVVSIKSLPDDIKHIIVIPYFDLEIIRIKVKKVRPDVRLLGIDDLLQ